MEEKPREASSLVAEAIRALDHAHPSNPPNLRFGAAVLDTRGNIFSASAFWSDSLSLVLHAEHAALAHAAAHGCHLISAIACVSTEDPTQRQHCHPCGLCKQLVYENARTSGLDVRVYMANLSGQYIARPISELVPFPWPAKDFPTA